MEQRLKVVGTRFIKALITGFVAGALVALPSIYMPEALTWSELSSLLPVLLYGVLVGGINGLLLAIDKFIRWIEIPLPNSPESTVPPQQ